MIMLGSLILQTVIMKIIIVSIMLKISSLIRTGITCKEIILEKSIEFCMALK